MDTDLSKCSYCGTSYFDFTSIDFEDGKPVYLKIKLPGGIILQQKAIPRLGSIEYNAKTTYAMSGNTKVMSFNNGYELTTDISFEGIADNNTLFRLEKSSG